MKLSPNLLVRDLWPRDTGWPRRLPWRYSTWSWTLGAAWSPVWRLGRQNPGIAGDSSHCHREEDRNGERVWAGGGAFRAQALGIPMASPPPTLPNDGFTNQRIPAFKLVQVGFLPLVVTPWWINQDLLWSVKQSKIIFWSHPSSQYIQSQRLPAQTHPKNEGRSQPGWAAVLSRVLRKPRAWQSVPRSRGGQPGSRRQPPEECEQLLK